MVLADLRWQENTVNVTFSKTYALGKAEAGHIMALVGWAQAWQYERGMTDEMRAISKTPLPFPHPLHQPQAGAWSEGGQEGGGIYGKADQRGLLC